MRKEKGKITVLLCAVRVFMGSWVDVWRVTWKKSLMVNADGREKRN